MFFSEVLVLFVELASSMRRRLHTPNERMPHPVILELVHSVDGGAAGRADLLLHLHHMLAVRARHAVLVHVRVELVDDHGGRAEHGLGGEANRQRTRHAHFDAAVRQRVQYHEHVGGSTATQARDGVHQRLVHLVLAGADRLQQTLDALGVLFFCLRNHELIL